MILPILRIFLAAINSETNAQMKIHMEVGINVNRIGHIVSLSYRKRNKTNIKIAPGIALKRYMIHVLLNNLSMSNFSFP